MRGLLDGYEGTSTVSEGASRKGQHVSQALLYAVTTAKAASEVIINHFLQSTSPGVSAASKLPDVYDRIH